MPSAPDPRLTAFARLSLQPGDTYRTPEGYLVFTRQYHLRRGFCCGSGCRHCPWRADGEDGEQKRRSC